MCLDENLGRMPNSEPSENESKLYHDSAEGDLSLYDTNSFPVEAKEFFKPIPAHWNDINIAFMIRMLRTGTFLLFRYCLYLENMSFCFG